MNNNNILRTALPFIVIFFISLFVAGYTYIHQNLSGASAAEDTLIVTAVNTQSPLSTTDQWQWSILASANKRPANPIDLTYTVNWCLDQDSTAPCIQNKSEDFFYQLGNGALTVNAQESTVKITHQSINCGRVNVEILRDGAVIARGAQSTQKQCTRDLANNASAYADSPNEIIDFINSVLKLVLGFFGDDNSGGGNNPGGTNPGAGGPGGGDVCTGQGAACNEPPYREACGEGDQAGTRVCYKYGTCSGSGSGLQCSWGDGSFCDPCEAGTKIDDPVPPMKPPQGGQPGNPGGGGPGGGGSPGQPAEPIPPPSNAEAKLATDLANYIRGNCFFPNYDTGGNKEAGLVSNYNAEQCMTALSGTRNDSQARAEIVASANTFSRLQCVGFVEASVAAASGRAYDGPTGNAGDRAHSGSGFQFIAASTRAVAPNDLAVWRTGTLPFGHIAYVISSSSTVMTVVEANYVAYINGQRRPCYGCVRSKTYTISDEIKDRGFGGWLRR